jgi:hypothetical protein
MDTDELLAFFIGKCTPNMYWLKKKDDPLGIVPIKPEFVKWNGIMNLGCEC